MNRFKGFTHRFLRDESGGVMILFGLFLTVFLGFIALAIVMGNSTILKARMQNASDAGALAGAYPDAASNADRTTLARRYFALNYPDNYLGKGMTADRARVEIIAATGTQPLGVRVSGTHRRTNEMMQVLDPSLNTATVNSNSLVQNGNTASVIDMMMVMDTSGSMIRNTADANVGGGESRIDAAVDAANIVVDELLDTPVRTGSTIRWLDFTYKCYWPPTLNPEPDYQNQVTRYDCRTPPGTGDPLFVSDTLTAAGPARARINDYGNRVNSYTNGPDAAYRDEPRHQTWFITNGIDALNRARGTLATPRTNAVRAVIYMTDGLNNLYNNKLYFKNPTDTNPNLDPDIVTNTIDACDNIKAEPNVILYVVGLGPEACNTTGQQLLRSCATGPSQYFCALNADELSGVFRSIITSVKTLRITE